MHTEHSNLSFEISINTLIEWNIPKHKHLFFELVYIVEGKGMQCISKNHFEYNKGDIFLLPPLNCHSFTIVEPTTFVFLKFSERLFKQNNSYEIDLFDWFEKISYILRNYNKSIGNIIKNKEDNAKIVRLIELIISEDKSKDRFSSTVIQSMVVGILNLLTRHIEKDVYNVSKPNDYKFNAILKFIQQNLCNNDVLKVSSLAKQFNVSPTYFSQYFKQNYGITFQKYILQSRLKIVETRLLYSDLTIKEIASETGFTDSSHLSNVFKKNYKISIGEFRKNGEFCLLKK